MTQTTTPRYEIGGSECKWTICKGLRHVATVYGSRKEAEAVRAGLERLEEKRA